MNVLRKCKINVKKEDMIDYLSALSVIRLFTPQSDYHLILTIKNFEIKEKNVSLFQPILREKILNIKPSKKNFILVYQTSQKNFTKLLEDFKKIKENFVIYGTNQVRKDKNLVFKKFSEKEFIEDLSSCKAIMMTGGFTTISEALYLKKPMLIVPAKNQYEQKFNGLTIQEMKIGECVDDLDKKTLKSFISKISFYEKNLEKIKKWDNKELLSKLDELIKELQVKKKPFFKFVRKVEALFNVPKYERTLTIIKPDAIEKNIVGEVMKRLEKQGIKPVAMKMIKINASQARDFYNHLKGKLPDDVFNSVIDYMTSTRVVLIVWQGRGVVKKVRTISGPTDPKKATKNNIRSLSNDDLDKKFKRGKAVENIIHSSATIKEAEKEIGFFFNPWEIHQI